MERMEVDAYNNEKVTIMQNINQEFIEAM